MSLFCWRKAELSVVSSSSEFESESASLDSDSAASAWTFLRKAMYAEFEVKESLVCWFQEIGPGRGWDQNGTLDFDFEGFFGLGFWASTHALTASRVWAWDILKAAHHLILNSLAKLTHPHPLLAAGVSATPQKSPAVTSND